jgi:2-polyprenyl-3-methyl-5-hydroxy-6-metoxy-1,4-benzoquinol methylase
VDFLRRYDVDATGLEPAEQLYEQLLKDKPGFFCQTTSEFAIQCRRKTFDVATSFDVLEHVADPMTFLCDIHELVKPGGCVFLSMPIVSIRPNLYPHS